LAGEPVHYFFWVSQLHFTASMGWRDEMGSDGLGAWRYQVYPSITGCLFSSTYLLFIAEGVSGTGTWRAMGWDRWGDGVFLDTDANQV
jgi:hypothetical protein